MSSLHHESHGSSNDQMCAVEQMQMQQAQILNDSGISRKIMMHIVERSEDLHIEDKLLTGLPLVLESSHELTSILYVGIRFMDDEAATKTRVVAIGLKDISNDHYQPYPISRFNKTDCLVVEELLAQVRAIKKVSAPDYSLEFGVLNE